MTGSLPFDSISWRKSSYSAAGQCVELAELPDSIIAIRNSNRPEAGTLTFTRAEMDAFIKGAKAGEFDSLT